MKIWRTHPMDDLRLVSGDGCIVHDDHGRAYVDMTSGCWCTVLGHGHPRLVAAAAAQSARLVHTGPPFVGDVLDAAFEKLAEIVPRGLDRAVWLNTGSEAVELAIKMARAATGRDALVVVERSYYGATNHALALSEAGRHATFLPNAGDVLRIPAPVCSRCPMGATWPCDGFPCLAPLRERIAARDAAFAAVLFEPILANAGVIVPPQGYASALRALASACGALFIAEEVTTGVGRTGCWFGVDHESVAPDILVVGKAIGAGWPVAAVITTTSVEEDARGKVTHVQSHQNDPFSAAIAAATISIIQDEGLVDRAHDEGAYLLASLDDVASRHDAIAEVRGRGLLAGVELRRDLAEEGAAMLRRLRESGFLVNYQPHNAAFRLLPPYVIERAQIDSFVHAFLRALPR